MALNALAKHVGPFDVTSTITTTPIERTHFSGLSGGGHHYHHEYSSHGGSGKHSIALTALTLLSFLFFLNILQNCLQETMDQNNQQQIIITQARIQAAREAEESAEKRKGETDMPPYSNITTAFEDLAKEPRDNPPKTHYNKYSHIPIKLKATEKFKNTLNIT